MKILMLHFLKNTNAKHKAIIDNLEKACKENQKDIDIMYFKDCVNVHFGLYDYIAVLISSSSFIGAKLPEKLSQLLSEHGSLLGKKGCALVLKSGFSSQKTSRLLMHAMEKEGMVIDYFDVLENAAYARAAGKKIG